MSTHSNYDQKSSTCDTMCSGSHRNGLDFIFFSTPHTGIKIYPKTRKFYDAILEND